MYLLIHTDVHVYTCKYNVHIHSTVAISKVFACTCTSVCIRGYVYMYMCMKHAYTVHELTKVVANYALQVRYCRIYISPLKGIIASSTLMVA